MNALNIVSFADLTATQIADFNATAFENLTADKVWITPDKAAELIGLRECTENEVPHFVHKTKRYIMEFSSHNRPISLDHCLRMAKEIVLPMRYVLNGETMIFSESGQAISCQHRLVAIWLGGLLGFTSAVPVLLVRGVPDEFADTVDSGRSRTQADNFARRPEILALDSLENWQGESFGNAAPKVRKTLVSDLTTVCNLLYMRATGCNVHASGKPETGVLHHLYRGFDTQLDAIVQLVYRSDLGMGESASWSKLISRPMIATALTLWQLRDSQPWSVEGNSLLMPELPTDSIDLEAMGEKLKELGSAYVDPTNGTSAAMLLTDLLKASSKEIKDGKVKRSAKGGLDRNYQFAAIVNWLNRPERGTKSYVPVDGTCSNKAYPYFGGVDVGYVEKKRTKAEKSGDVDSQE